MPGLRVVIEPPPAWTVIARASRPGVPPDLAIIVPLVDVAAGYGDLLRFVVVIELLPTRTGIATARSAGIAPNAAIVVQLNKLAATGRDCCGRRVIV